MQGSTALMLNDNPLFTKKNSGITKMGYGWRFHRQNTGFVDV